MNPKLRKATQKLCEPIFEAITKSKLLDVLPINLSSLPAKKWTDKITDLTNSVSPEKWKLYFKSNLTKIEKITAIANDKFTSLKPISDLAVKDPAAARLILENTDNISNATRLAEDALGSMDIGINKKNFKGIDISRN